MSLEEAVVPMDRLARVYRRIRAKEQELTRTYEAELEALKVQRDEIAAIMLDEMKRLGVKSVRTDEGTVTLLQSNRYYASDWEEFGKFVLEHNALDLLERRIAQKNMDRFLAENPETAPPGLASDSKLTISVRKPV
jgi:hypothetical protein